MPKMHYALLPISERIHLILFLVIVTSVFVIEAMVLLRYLYFRISNKKSTPLLPKKLELLFHGVSLLGVLCIAWGFFIEPWNLQVTHIQLNAPQLTRPITIVQISDTHCDPLIRNEDKAATIINQLKPDIICFTGDTINSIEALPNFKKFMNSLKAKSGKYAVTGNYESHYWSKINIFANTGFELLSGKLLQPIKDQPNLTLTGLNIYAQSQLSKLLRGLTKENFNIFLYHIPHITDQVKKFPVDLFLAGHIHGGQVALPWWGAIITFSPTGKKYEQGLYDLGRLTLYISRGLGMEGGKSPRVRFMSRPEITVFQLTPSNQ
jgi:hypothetical protein